MKTVSEFQLKLARVGEVEWYLLAIMERFLPLNRGAMTSKERMRRAIEFGSPDRIPHRFYDDITIINTVPCSWQPHESYYPYVHPYDVNFGGLALEQEKGHQVAEGNAHRRR